MKTRVKRTWVSDEGFEFRFEPVSDTIQIKKTKDGFEARYLTYDQDTPNPLEDCDGLGRIYTSKRHAGKEEHAAFRAALGLNDDWERDPEIKRNPYAVKLDVYSHGGEVYSISGEGMQCQFDTARGGAVWVPDKCLEEELAALPEAKRAAKALEFARQALEQFNAWLGGETFCLVREDFNAKKEPQEYDIVGGYIGREYAEQSLPKDI